MQTHMRCPTSSKPCFLFKPRQPTDGVGSHPFCTCRKGVNRRRQLQDGKPAADVFLTIKFSNLTRCKGRGKATRGQYPKQGIMNKRGFSEQPCTKGALSPPPQSIPSKMTNAAQDTGSSKPFWRISRRALLNAPCRLSPCVSPS